MYASLDEEVEHGRAALDVHADDPLGGHDDAHVHAALQEVHRVEVVVVAARHQVRRRVAGNRRLKRLSSLTAEIICYPS